MTRLGAGPASATGAVLVGALLAFPSRGLVAQACENTGQDSLAVRAVASGIVSADNAKDVERALGFYAVDAVLHPPGEGPVEGRDAIRPRYEGLFASYAPSIVSEIDAISVCGDLAVVAGRNGGVLRGLHGVDDRRLDDAFVMVLGRRGAVWRITRLIWHPDGGRRAVRRPAGDVGGHALHEESASEVRMSVELYREEGANFRSVRLRIEGDRLILDTHDMGEATEAAWGDSDYEFWTSVGRQHWGELLLALITEYMSDRSDATDRLRDICRKHEVPHDWDSWV